METQKLIDLLKSKIPEDLAWGGKGEPYGEYNTHNLSNVKRVLYCVTPTKEVQKYFTDHKYDLLISHHPMMTKLPQLIFHTALDCCEGGLNDIFAKHLGIVGKPFDGHLGQFGELPQELTIRELKLKIMQLTGDVIGQVYTENPEKKIKTICICTGLGGLVTNIAQSNSKADCYITGELTKPAETSGFEFCIEIGHTLSEQIGVRFFRKELEQFGVTVDLAPISLDVFGLEHYNGKMMWSGKPWVY